jgi:hypothetical protein
MAKRLTNNTVTQTLIAAVSKLAPRGRPRGAGEVARWDLAPASCAGGERVHARRH